MRTVYYVLLFVCLLLLLLCVDLVRWLISKFLLALRSVHLDPPSRGRKTLDNINHPQQATIGR